MPPCCDNDCCSLNATHERQRKTLRIVLAINALMFFVIAAAAIVSHSSALLADSLDNFGDAVTYGLYNAQQRGTLLVGAGEKVYEGMVIGYTASGEDVDVNVCKTKHLTNTRASGSDDALRLIPVSKLSLEGCLEFLAQDELLEVTPENLRIRKQILNHDQRMKAKSKLK